MTSKKLLFAKTLRFNQTNAEKILWYHLRSRRLAGIKFRRQQLIGNYIVDFVSFERKLVVELDGAAHKKEIQKINDKNRTKWLMQEGYKVLRFWNYDVLKRIDKILMKVERTARNHPHPSLLPSREKEKYTET